MESASHLPTTLVSVFHERGTGCKTGTHATGIHARRAIERGLTSLHAPELRQLSDLQAECRRRTLFTILELDHYGPRASGDYFPLQVAATPTTQQTGDVAEVFAYLKHRPEMLRLIEFLRQQRRRVEIVFGTARHQN